MCDYSHEPWFPSDNMWCTDAEKRYIVEREGGNCRAWRYSCSPPSFTRIATFSGGVFMTLYLLLYIYYLHRGFVLLRSRPYNSFRVGNVLVRLQVLICAPLQVWLLPHASPSFTTRCQDSNKNSAVPGLCCA